jgi:polyribonucleotide 5'-hydroxyl-kinase
MTWLIDFVGYNRKNQPPWKVSLQTLTIVQNHYPERLGKAVNFAPPMLFELFYKAIRPFVDPVTRDKLVFLHQNTDAAEGMGAQFHLEFLDEPICGSLEEDGMWNFENYKEKMKKQEEEARLKIEIAKKNMGMDA